MTENDPEIGGLSTSNLIGKADRLAWDGTVEIVPSLDTPGFCLACVMMIVAYSIVLRSRVSASKRLSGRATRKEKTLHGRTPSARLDGS